MSERYSKSSSRNYKFRDTEAHLNKLSDRMHHVDINNGSKASSSKQMYVTNYVKVGSNHAQVYKYSITFLPSVDSTGLRYKLLFQHENIFGSVKSFDGTTLYLPQELPKSQFILTSSLSDSDHEVQIRVRFLEVIPISECSHLISTVLRKALTRINLQRVGNGYYSPDLGVNIQQQNLSLWPGFRTSLRLSDGSLLWNIDASYKLFRKDCALDILGDVYSRSKDFCADSERALLGQTVITRYNNKTYRIDDIAWNKSPRDTFEWKNGQQISFIEYYRKVYNLEVTDTDQPLLINLPKKSKNAPPIASKNDNQLDLICLIPEFCFLTGLTPDMQNDWRLMKELSCHFHMSPKQRCKTIQSLVNIIHKTPEAKNELDSWGITLSSSLYEVEGKLLSDEPIFDSSNSPIATNTKGAWHNKLTKIQPISTPHLKEWLCVYNERDSQIVYDFMHALEKSSQQCSLKIDPPKLVGIRNDNTESYINLIRSEISNNPNLGLIMSVFSTQREDRYAAFKKLLCCHTAIPSQAVLTKTIKDKRKLSTVSNRIALQINCKLGGELWRVHIPMSNIMVIGVDTYHSTASGTRKSVVGFVSSLNDNLTRWFSHVAFQAQSHEFAESFSAFLPMALKKYFEINHALPKKIIVFRDGIGKGQMQTALTLEVDHIKEALERIYKGSSPNLIYLIIKKRILTRYFLNNEKNEADNPAPGSVITNLMNDPEFPGFFLVSQNFAVGTVLPINLVVLYNSSNLSLDQIQKFTYKCTFLYYNWSGTVRVPAPCLYAHKVAFMAGQYLHSQPSSSLSTKLYFI